MLKMRWIYLILKFSGLLWIFTRILIKGNKHVVLCYHRISKEKLNQHINYYKSQFNVVPLKTLLNTVFQNNTTTVLGNKKIMLSLTMDDCYTDDFFHAFKVCQSNKVHCTYFVPTFYSEGNMPMWPLRFVKFLESLNIPSSLYDFNGTLVCFNSNRDIQKFSSKWFNEFQNGITQTLEIEKIFDVFFNINNFSDRSSKVIDKEIILSCSKNPYATFESHSYSHAKLTFCNDNQLNEEFINSLEYLDELIPDKSHNVFCYPYGGKFHIGESYKKLSNYYKFGVTLQKGVISKKSNKVLLPRIPIYEKDSIYSIRMKILFAGLTQMVS